MKYTVLLKKVVAIRPDIIAAVVIANGKIVEQIQKDKSKIPPEQELPRMVLQSQLIIGITSTNEKVIGKAKFALVCHEHMNAMFFPLEDKKVLIVPFIELTDLEGLGTKVLKLVHKK